MKKYIIIIYFIFVIFLIKGQVVKHNESWIKSDSLFIAQVVKTLRTDYKKLPLLIQIGKNMNYLGFGYSLIDSNIGKGYFSFSYQLIYKDEKLISFKLDPRNLSDTLLRNRYKIILKGLFEYSDNEFQSLYFNYDSTTQPLTNLNIEYKLNNLERFFMTPYSGVVYGDKGGIINSPLLNREVYDLVKDSINEKLLLNLLYSINPATRLCAIEHYYKNKWNFSDTLVINNRIQEVFKETPTIYTMSGCTIYKAESKKVVDYFVKKDKKLVTK